MGQHERDDLEKGMNMTPEEKYLNGIDLTGLPPQAGPALVAIGQYSNGEQITANCPKCQKLITISELGAGYAWFVNCECGLCRDTLRGILKEKPKKPKIP